MTMQARKTDLQPGQQFGHWTVIKKVGVKNNSKQAFYLCRCSCGTEKEVNGSNLRCGISESCGCQRGIWYNRDVFQIKKIDKDKFLTDLSSMYTQDLVEKYGISKPTITRLRKKYNVKPLKEQNEESYKDELIRLNDSGLTVREIATKMHQQPIYVYNRLMQLGKNPNYTKQICNTEAMSQADRSTKKGFKFYWSNRPFHFQELYGLPYNPINAARAFEGQVND